jgi:hypothetical protein
MTPDPGCLQPGVEAEDGAAVSGAGAPSARRKEPEPISVVRYPDRRACPAAATVLEPGAVISARVAGWSTWPPNKAVCHFNKPRWTHRAGGTAALIGIIRHSGAAVAFFSLVPTGAIRHNQAEIVDRGVDETQGLEERAPKKVGVAHPGHFFDDRAEDGVSRVGNRSPDQYAGVPIFGVVNNFAELP